MKAIKNNKIHLYIFILGMISIINLINAKYLNSSFDSHYIKQAIWFVLGFIILFISKKIPFSKINRFSNYFYLLCILLLLITLFVGKEINGTRAWLDFGFFNLQASELMKISLCLTLYRESFSKRSTFKKFIFFFILTLIPSILVFLEPDTGAIIFYLIIFFVMCFSLKLPFKYYLFLGLIGILGIGAFTYMYLFKQDLLIKLIGTSFFYRIDRILNFRSNNYQLDLSLISIFGTSLIRNGFNNILIYVPEGTTDFIFAFIIGNYGIIVGLLIIVLYILMILEIFKKFNQNKKTNYIIISFLACFIFQILINILMNIGLFPIIGITLPFLSYGGSSILMYFLFLGLILSISESYQ